MSREKVVSDALTVDTGDDRPVLTPLLESVATVRSVDPVELPPLYDVIDTDALVALLGSPRSEDCRLTVEFDYADCRVTVDAGGSVQVRDLAPEADAGPPN